MKYSEIEGRIGAIYLTNNENAIALYNWICARYPTTLLDNKLDIEWLYEMKPKLIISYNYKYKISKEVIDFMQGNIINLHISYLPWNRGSSPNIWSFIDDTPKGVTIHQVSPEYDAGNILYQKECFFYPEKETFETVYNKLNDEITKLFKKHWDEIRDMKYPLIAQEGVGSFHTLKDLKKLKDYIEFQWSDNVAVFLERYRKMKEN